MPLSLVTIIWCSKCVPSAWKQAFLVPILEKEVSEDSRDGSNYRVISLLSIVGKISTKIIQSRLQSSHEEQSWFRLDRGCVRRKSQMRQVDCHCLHRFHICFWLPCEEHWRSNTCPGRSSGFSSLNTTAQLAEYISGMSSLRASPSKLELTRVILCCPCCLTL